VGVPEDLIAAQREQLQVVNYLINTRSGGK